MVSDKNQVAIIDYGMGNLLSIQRACEVTLLKPVITSSKSIILNSDALILPGVGAFGEAMNNLQELDLINPIREFISGGKPFMGICLGMQLLMSASDEFGDHKGLDIIEGCVSRFPKQNNGEKIKVPHVGWSAISRPLKEREDFWDDSPLKKIPNNEFMYFTHSYYAVPANAKVITSITEYEGTTFCSSLFWKNIFACQFHPEKSAEKGLEIYKDFISSIRRDAGQ